MARLIFESDVLEATVMSSLPTTIADRVYEHLESRHCECPAGCSDFFHIEELPQVSREFVGG